jgi:hypothetical protein
MKSLVWWKCAKCYKHNYEPNTACWKCGQTLRLEVPPMRYMGTRTYDESMPTLSTGDSREEILNAHGLA